LATALNGLFFTVVIAWFYRTFAHCREEGLLVKAGE
jgi:hypothetical protein